MTLLATPGFERLGALLMALIATLPPAAGQASGQTGPDPEPSPIEAAANPAIEEEPCCDPEGVVSFRLGSLTAASGKRLRIAPDETWTGNVYFGGAEVEVEGTIEGDLAAGTNKLSVSGSVEQDVGVGAGNVSIDGKIGGDLRAACGELRIEGTVDGELIAVCGVVMIAPTATVRGPALIYGGQIRILGSLEGPVEIGAGQVEIEGTIGSDARVKSDVLTFGPLAKIDGDLVYSTRNKVRVPEGAVTGKVTERELPEETKEELAREAAESVSRAFSAFWLFLDVYLAFVALLAGVLMWLFFQPFVDGSLQRAASGSAIGVGLGVGLVSSLVILVVGVFCLIFIPLSLALWSGLGALVYFGSLIGKMIVGRFTLWPLLKRPAHPLLALLIGIILLFLIGLVPYVGGLVKAFVTLTGMGIILLQIRGGAGPVGEFASPAATPPGAIIAG